METHDQDLDSASPDVDQTERVILVHGTFAASPDDAGTAWWQVDSGPYQELQRQLPSGVSLAKRGEVFHWSGENHERARSKAAVELLHYLAPLEKAGRGYHLIGHSHGGSVIWAALRIATTRNKPLQSLRSWSTVGTPFLHHRSRSPWNVLNLAYMILAAMLLMPAAKTFLTLVKLPYDLAMGNLDDGIMIRYPSEAGFVVAIVRAPILETLRLLGVAFTDTPTGIRLGSYTPDSGQSMTDFLLMTTEGWLILAAIVGFGYLTLLLGSWFVSPVLESMRAHWEQKLEQRAFDTYASRWLGIWTTEDEAINGLRATLDLSVSFLGKLVPRERVFLSDALSLLSRPCLWICGPIYNFVLRPMLDTTIRGVVVKAAQGNNRPAAQVVAVTPCPLLAPEAPNVPPLPHTLRTKILTAANKHANELGPKIRQLLAEPSFTAGLDKFNQDLAGRELVHTSYFDHNEVIALLAENIRWAGDATTSSPFVHPDLRSWFADHKQLLGAVASQPVVARDTTGIHTNDADSWRRAG